MLAHHIAHEDAANNVVLLHGFTQSRAMWDDFVSKISLSSRVVTVDLPGHGGSSGIAASLPEAGDLVADLGGVAAYVGYSLGARVALHTALQHPASVSKLVLCGANPGIVDSAERAQRKHDDDVLASHIEDIGVEQFINEWLATPLFARLTAAEQDRASRLVNSAPGLASSLRTMGLGTQENLWPSLSQLTMPVLIITGADDEKFTNIGERMVSSIGAQARHIVVPQSGHSVPLEQPNIFCDLISAFIAD
jgi:2-succinyl-6-hydroxy-2,4-cyclohexadiene-1-carboxylate synthase